jgi:exopolysaccharide biosynthesis WecB/TagA/CpsF family protein
MNCGILKRNLLGAEISVTTYAEVVAAITEAARQRRALKFTALDAHGLSRAAKDPRFRSIINSFDIVSPDGHSLKWGLNRLHGADLKDRVAGPDLTIQTCRAARDQGLPVFLYGSRGPVVERFRARLQELLPGLVVSGVQPSRFRPSTPEEDAYDIDLVRKSGARLVLVGLGCPLQEQWISQHYDRLSMPLLAVGAAFDFVSGNKPRAPKWMQDSGIEWVFRIVSEPRRLVRRSIPAVTHVFFALLRQRLRRASGKPLASSVDFSS